MSRTQRGRVDTLGGSGIKKKAEHEGLGILHGYGRVTESKIISICANSQYVFISDVAGNIKQFSLVDNSISNESPKCTRGRIISMVVVSGSIFVSDDWGYLKEISAEDLSLKTDYGHIHKGGIWSIIATQDSKSVYTSDDQGHIKQFSVLKSVLTKDHGVLRRTFVRAIQTCPENSYFFLSDLTGHLLQYKMSERDLKLDHDYQQIHKGGIRSLACTKDAKYLFTTEYNGIMKQWNYKDKSMVKYYGNIHACGINCVVTLYNKDSIECIFCTKEYMFTSSANGFLTQHRLDEPIMEDEAPVEEENLQQSIGDVLS
jgi:myo-inositol-hexaphosphate 3-phosphohydrolase